MRKREEAREEERREMQEGGREEGKGGREEGKEKGREVRGRRRGITTKRLINRTNLKAAVAFCTMVSMEMLVTCERPQPSLPRSNTCNRERPWYTIQCG